MKDAEFFRGVFMEPIGYMDCDRCQLCGEDIAPDETEKAKHLASHEARGHIERAGPRSGVAAVSRSRRVLLTIGRHAEERTGDSDEQYLLTDLVFEAMSPERADHQVRLITRYATKLGFRVRRGAYHSVRLGPE